MRLAFIGGNGHHYLRGAVKDPACQVEQPIAVASDGYQADDARRIHAAFPGALWFDSPADMLDKFRPDVVNVGAVYAHNGEMNILALERGVAVCSDKPVASSWEQLEQLRELLAQPGRKLVTEFPFRCDRAFLAAQAAISAGKIGPVVLASGQKSYRFRSSRPAWYGRREDYGGTILWVAGHAIDFICFTTGLKMTSLFGHQGNVSKSAYGTMEDHTLSAFRMENGATAFVHADFCRPEKAATHGDDRLRVVGGCGVLEIRDGRCRLTTDEQSDHDITESVPEPAPVHQQLLAALNGAQNVPYGNAHSLEMAQLLLEARDHADAMSGSPAVPAR